MKLNEEQKNKLLDFGYEKSDLQQIEDVIPFTTFHNEKTNKKITLEEALSILGENAFLSGLGRSAFHWRSYRENEDGVGVFFDSSKYFDELPSDEEILKNISVEIRKKAVQHLNLRLTEGEDKEILIDFLNRCDEAPYSVTQSMIKKVESIISIS